MIVIDDNLNFIKTLDNDSIDLIYFNPPYGTTEQPWDKPLNWKELFQQMNRVIKPKGNIVIHCSIPFTYDLIREKKPKYHWVWNKMAIGSPFLAKKQPLRNVEEILVYHKNKCSGVYYPQMIGDEITISRGGKSKYYGSRHDLNYRKELKGHYPKQLITYNRKIDGFSTRPPELIEFIVKSYTKETDIVLDLTCYKGLSGDICEKINRRWIGVDIHDWRLNEN